ncbi:hypothetical protein [Microbacterium stercoris]|uniref:Uncharacterized protein n=1 Tax=Microbacterium stercoris TaxID=2820289 RepID=A0A939QIU1_9MICO|nr:hypothetical protein [Microbacterium stercoris]MBO3663697.1 hypothetical protein [Microbacterium stercoris]
MISLRWAFIIAAATCAAVAVWTRTPNGVALLAIITAGAAAATFPAVTGVLAGLAQWLYGTPTPTADCCRVEHADASEDDLIDQDEAHRRAALLMWLDGQIDILDRQYPPR